jgi:hypothetical protein
MSTSSDDERIVGVVGGVKLEDRIVVNEVEQALGPQHEAGNDLVRVDGLPLVVDHARLNQVDHAVGEHLGVDAQVAMIAQQPKHGVGNPSDAGLQRGPVRNQAGDVARDGAMHAGDFVRLHFGQRVRALDDGVDLGHVEKRVAQRARALVVHLDDD